MYTSSTYNSLLLLKNSEDKLVVVNIANMATMLDISEERVNTKTRIRTNDGFSVEVRTPIMDIVDLLQKD